jgi:hypothetical protein
LEGALALIKFVEYADACPEVRAIYDDVKQVMAPVRSIRMVYIAVSATNGCE